MGRRYRIKKVFVKIEMPYYTGVEMIAIRLLMKKSREWGGIPISSVYVYQQNDSDAILRAFIKFNYFLDAIKFCKYYGVYF